MAKPMVHAESSVKKWGGCTDDYLPLHEEMDSSKAAHASVRHRAVFHSAFGVFLIERIFGKTLVNSDGRVVHVRDVAEQHVIEDLGFIPDLGDWLNCMTLEPWMGRRGGRPERRKETTEPTGEGPEVTEPPAPGKKTPDELKDLIRRMEEEREKSRRKAPTVDPTRWVHLD